jgi:hypothetical protein
MVIPKYFSFGCIIESELLEDSPISLGCVDLGKGDHTEASAKIKVLENDLKGAMEEGRITLAKTKALENKLKGAIEEEEISFAKIKALENTIGNLMGAIDEEEITSAKSKALENNLKWATKTKALENKLMGALEEEEISFAKIKALENNLMGAIDVEEITSAKIKALENNLKGAMEGERKTSAKIISLEIALKRAMKEIEMMTNEKLVYMENAEIRLKRVMEDKVPEVREIISNINDVLLAKEVVITELNLLMTESLATQQAFLMEDSKWSNQAEILAAPIEIISDSDTEGASINPTDKISQILEKSQKLKLERKQKLDAATWKAQSKENLDEILRLRKDLGVTYENIVQMQALLKTY